MKKLLGVLMLLVFFTSCNQQKIAYVDFEKIVKEYNGSIEAEKEMQAESDQLSAGLDQMASEFQANVQNYQQKMQGLSATAKAEQEQVLMQQQQRLQQQQQMAQQQLQTKGQEKMDKINDEIEAYIKEYALKNGYSFILGTSDMTNTVLFGDEKLDLTEVVIENLNKLSEVSETPVEEAVEEMSEEEPASNN
ncbi:OmpH family outer membrane protein [Namhaeicola litoreus]|uniref:OmpH family outer membrane protein n=1 Tax=Namhaeicola litoreus TaxID=1052145 RepID=A0ABW3Y1X8_9FLAO